MATGKVTELGLTVTSESPEVRDNVTVTVSLGLFVSQMRSLVSVPSAVSSPFALRVGINLTFETAGANWTKSDLTKPL